jgi:hypothetical protein
MTWIGKSGFLAAIAALSMTIGCGDDSPTQPSNPIPANPSLTAPAAATPSDDEQLDTLRPTLTVQNGTSNIPGVPRAYEFQIADTAEFAASFASFSRAYRVVLSQTGVPEGGAGRTSFTTAEDLQPATRFYWRARLTQGTSVSPWSSTQRFRTKVEGYNRAGELFDPLTNGRTVGTIAGSRLAQFTPGKGLQILDETAYVKYVLPQTITQGEFSVITENVANGSGDGKNKILAMKQGPNDGEITTNLYRVTVEKRGAPNQEGVIGWRLIPGDNDQRVDTEFDERISVNFTASHSYLWKATWGGTFRVEIFDGSNRIYNLGKAYQGTYRPSPQHAFLGAPTGRAGPVDASVPGVIYRLAWLADKPRPQTLGSAIAAP